MKSLAEDFRHDNLIPFKKKNASRGGGKSTANARTKHVGNVELLEDSDDSDDDGF